MVKPFKIYFLTHSLLSDFQEKGGVCSMEAEENLFNDLYALEENELDVDIFLNNINFDFELGKRDLKRAYKRFLEYVKYK